MSEEHEIIPIFDNVLRWVTPILACVISLIVFIYRSKVKDLETANKTEKEEREKAITREQEERERAIQEIAAAMSKNEEDRKKVDKELIQSFRDGLKDERVFRTEVMIEQADNIKEIFKNIKELHGALQKFTQKLDSNIENQERICKINHNRNLD